MADLATDGAQVTWETPECPFSIEYSVRVLDDIRLAVVDAFFSLPRGGAEIGGVLLGTQEPGRLAITSYQAIECEHATGPSFTLSPKDETRLRDQLAKVRGQVVGWYHSHTRSAISLSEADLDIYKRFFPEPWQIALVMKPHAFQPVYVGLFFRERDGRIHASAAYREMLLEPLQVRQVHSGEPGFHPSPAVPYSRETDNRSPGGVTPGGAIIDLVLPKEETAPPVLPALVKPPDPQPAAVPAGVPVVAPVVAAGPWSRAAMRLQEVKAQEPHPVVVTTPDPTPPAPVPPYPVSPALVPSGAQPEPDPPLPAPPNFLVTQPEPSRRWRGTLAIAAGLVLGAAGFQTRESWLPPLTATVKSTLPSSGPPSFGLNTLDSNGQLQIRWDRNSLPVRTGVAAILEIADDAEARPQTIPMDPQHIQAGVFTYGRQGDKVEVKLTIRMPDGGDIRQVTTFLGALPPRAPPEDPEVRRQRDELAKALAAQEKRTRKLERSLSEVQKTLKEDQLKRLENQVPAK
jgi:proteasome lid subunit RPN8/RPN11